MTEMSSITAASIAEAEVSGCGCHSVKHEFSKLQEVPRPQMILCQLEFLLMSACGNERTKSGARISSTRITARVLVTFIEIGVYAGMFRSMTNVLGC